MKYKKKKNKILIILLWYYSIIDITDKIFYFDIYYSVYDKQAVNQYSNSYRTS